MDEVISKALCKYKNLIIMGDFKQEACFKKKNNKSIIDLISKNRTLHFPKKPVVKTRLSDYHKMISTFSKHSHQN